MRRRLEQLLSETFEYEKPVPVLSCDSIRLEVKEGTAAGGVFTVSHPQERRIRGFVYSSNPRMKIEPEEFYSSAASIRFRVDTTGLEAGGMTEGVFTLSTDLGELHVPCSVSVKGRNAALSGNGQTEEETKEETEGQQNNEGGGTGGEKEKAFPAKVPTDLNLLVKTAREDYTAACELFASEEFRESLKKESASVRTLYQALITQEGRERGLEEFLIGCGKKEPVEISLDRNKIQMADPEGTVLETLKISCSGWGYLEMDISSDARFLRPEKKSVTTRDFGGSEYELRFIIDSNFLHAGSSYARIRIRTSYQTLLCDVRVDRSTTEDHRQHRVRALMVRRAVQLYLDYRLGRIDLRSWTDRSESVIGSYLRAGGTDPYADLLHIFVLQAEGRKARAEKLLSDLEKNKILTEDPSRYAVWLYLSTFFRSGQDEVNEVRRKVRQLYLKNRRCWVIRWLQLYLLEDEFPTDSARLDLIVQQIRLGCNSPVMYLEGALILQKNPWLIHEWNLPVRMIVDFASRNGLMTEQLYLQTAGLVLRKPQYDPATFRLLGRCYEQSQLRDILTAWCTLAVAGEKRDERYFPIYQAAVSRELTINGLYEYYMETMGECRIERMPQIIRRYFVYNDALDWRRKAKIYRNISDSRENIPQIYSSMLPAIRSFMTDQLRMSRINSDLAVLYARYIDRKALTQEQARHLVQILFTFEIDCRNPAMKKVLTADVRLQKNPVVQISGRKAQIQIYSEDSRILLEDDEGRRYASTSLYMAEHLLDAPALMNVCARIVPDDPGIVLFYCLNAGGRQKISHKNLGYFLSAVNMSALSEEFRRQVRGWLLDYYTDHPDEENLFHFLRHINYADYIALDRQKLLYLLTQEGLYEEAYGILEKYGPENLPVPLLVRICSQMVIACEFEERSFLSGLCGLCFSLGKYDENILRYLILYYEGPLALMRQIWAAAHEYELETMDLERKILSMLLFTGEDSSGSEGIYLNYRASLGNRRLCQAYVILKSYRYLVKGEPTSELLFEDILSDYLKGGQLPDTCALALLQYLSGLIKLTEEKKKTASKLLEQFSSRGIRFAFFQRFPAELTDPLSIDDKVFLECVADPASSVKLYYRFRGTDGEWTEETMRDVFQGIRVREFVLFGSEELECRTEEISPEGEHFRSSLRTLRARAVPESLKNSRYGKLFAMAQKLEEGSREEYLSELEDYQETDLLTRELFTLL